MVMAESTDESQEEEQEEIRTVSYSQVGFSGSYTSHLALSPGQLS